jgi:hypothetical protein
MGSNAVRRDNIPAKVKVAVQYLIETKDDLKGAALHAQISLHELRRYLSKPQCLRYAREQKKLALEALCLTVPSTLREVMSGDNEMARLHAVKTAEALRMDAVELEQRGTLRQPGLQIVIVGGPGPPQVVPTMPPRPLLDVTPAPAREAEPVPADTEAE